MRQFWWITKSKRLWRRLQWERRLLSICSKGHLDLERYGQNVFHNVTSRFGGLEETFAWVEDANRRKMAAYLLEGLSSGRTSEKAGLTQERSLKLPGVHARKNADRTDQPNDAVSDAVISQIWLKEHHSGIKKAPDGFRGNLDCYLTWQTKTWVRKWVLIWIVNRWLVVYTSVLELIPRKEFESFSGTVVWAQFLELANKTARAANGDDSTMFGKCRV